MTDAKRQPPWFDEKNAVELPEGFDWTPQEQWAWAHILRGDVANMSLFAGPRGSFATFAEWYAGKDDGAGHEANAVDDKGALVPWPESRVLRAIFLQLILFQEPYASAPARPQARFSEARIDELLDWSAERYGGELWLFACRFAAPVNWFGLKVAGLLTLQGARFGQRLAADRLQTGGSLFCRNGFTAKSSVRLLGAKIGGDVSFVGATLEAV